MKAEVIIKRSDKKDKKYIALIDNSKKVYFGGAGYSDFTIHKDELRKQRYIARHQKNERWGADDYDTAGFWSRWLIWNLPTLEASAKDIMKRFGINVKLEI